MMYFNKYANLKVYLECIDDLLNINTYIISLNFKYLKKNVSFGLHIKMQIMVCFWFLYIYTYLNKEIIPVFFSCFACESENTTFYDKQSVKKLVLIDVCAIKKSPAAFIRS